METSRSSRRALWRRIFRFCWRHTDAKWFGFPHESQVLPFAGQVVPGGWLGYPQFSQSWSSRSSEGIRGAVALVSVVPMIRDDVVHTFVGGREWGGIVVVGVLVSGAQDKCHF